jgi:iron(III) transport system permease protein
VVLIVLSLGVVALQRAAVRKRNVAGNLIRKAAPKRLDPAASVVAHVVCYAIVLASSLPSLVVIYTSFRKTSGPVSRRATARQLREDLARDPARHQQQRGLRAHLRRADRRRRRADRLRGRASRDSMDGMARRRSVRALRRAGGGAGLAFVVTFNVKPIEITGTATIIVLMLFIPPPALSQCAPARRS